MWPPGAAHAQGIKFEDRLQWTYSTMCVCTLLGRNKDTTNILDILLTLDLFMSGVRGYGSTNYNYMSFRRWPAGSSRTEQFLDESLAHFYHALASHLPRTTAHRASRHPSACIMRVCHLGAYQQGQTGGRTPIRAGPASQAGERKQVGGDTTILLRVARRK
jgi:hypothetical protein